MPGKMNVVDPSPAPAPDATKAAPAVAPAPAVDPTPEVDPDHVRPEVPRVVVDGVSQAIREVSPAFDAGPAEIPAAPAPDQAPKKGKGPTVKVKATMLGRHERGDDVPISEFQDEAYLDFLIARGFVEKSGDRAAPAEAPAS